MNSSINTSASKCSFCKAFAVKTHYFEDTCESCGTVNHTDYLEREPEYTTNDPFFGKSIPDYSTELAIEIWPEINTSLMETANELFHDFLLGSNTRSVKGQHRISLIYAALFFSQNLMNRGRRTMSWFMSQMVDPKSFSGACTELSDFMFRSRKWFDMVSRPVSLDENIAGIIAELAVPEAREREVRKRAYQLQDYLRSASSKARELSGFKDMNVHVALVYAACKSLKIKVLDPTSVGLATVTKVVKILMKK